MVNLWNICRNFATITDKSDIHFANMLFYNFSSSVEDISLLKTYIALLFPSHSRDDLLIKHFWKSVLYMHASYDWIYWFVEWGSWLKKTTEIETDIWGRQGESGTGWNSLCEKLQFYTQHVSRFIEKRTSNSKICNFYIFSGLELPWMPLV